MMKSLSKEKVVDEAVAIKILIGNQIEEVIEEEMNGGVVNKIINIEAVKEVEVIKMMKLTMKGQKPEAVEGADSFMIMLNDQNSKAVEAELMKVVNNIVKAIEAEVNVIKSQPRMDATMIVVEAEDNSTSAEVEVKGVKEVVKKEGAAIGMITSEKLWTKIVPIPLQILC
jgi:hypothetical protein